MLNLFRKKKSQPDVSEMILSLQKHIDFRFNEVSAQIKEVELGLAQMETKLLTKDLKDKQAYGLLHYKLHEAKNHRLDSDIEDLKERIDFRNKLKDV